MVACDLGRLIVGSMPISAVKLHSDRTPRRKFRLDSRCPTIPATMACMNIGKCKTQSAAPKGRLSLSYAIRVRSAELWLMPGEADEALRELEALSKGAWNHPWAKQVRIAALRVLDGRTGAIVQE